MSNSASAASSMRVAPFSTSLVLERLGGHASRLVWGLAFGMALMAAVAVGLWIATGDESVLFRLFRSSAACFLLGLSLVECVLGISCWVLFDVGEPLRRAWCFLALSSAFRLAGLAAVQIVISLGAGEMLSKSGAPGSEVASIRTTSLGALNPIATALMLVGLLMVLKAYLEVGLLRRPSWPIVSMLVLVGTLVATQAVPAGFWRGNPAGPLSVLASANWVTGPLLGLLLAESILLYRAVAQMGDGLVASCWGSYTIAIFLTSFGDMGVAAMTEGRMPWQYVYVNSVVWLVAALAYALAPAYQVEAVVRARTTGAADSGIRAQLG